LCASAVMPSASNLCAEAIITSGEALFLFILWVRVHVVYVMTVPFVGANMGLVVAGGRCVVPGGADDGTFEW